MAEPHPHARSQDPKLTTPPSGIPPLGMSSSDNTSASATGPARQNGGDVINNTQPSLSTTASATTQPAATSETQDTSVESTDSKKRRYRPELQAALLEETKRQRRLHSSKLKLSNRYDQLEDDTDMDVDSGEQSAEPAHFDFDDGMASLDNPAAALGLPVPAETEEPAETPPVDPNPIDDGDVEMVEYTPQDLGVETNPLHGLVRMADKLVYRNLESVPWRPCVLEIVGQKGWIGSLDPSVDDPIVVGSLIVLGRLGTPSFALQFSVPKLGVQPDWNNPETFWVFRYIWEPGVSVPGDDGQYQITNFDLQRATHDVRDHAFGDPTHPVQDWIARLEQEEGIEDPIPDDGFWALREIAGEDNETRNPKGHRLVLFRATLKRGRFEGPPRVQKQTIFQALPKDSRALEFINAIGRADSIQVSSWMTIHGSQDVDEWISNMNHKLRLMWASRHKPLGQYCKRFGTGEVELHDDIDSIQTFANHMYPTFQSGQQKLQVDAILRGDLTLTWPIASTFSELPLTTYHPSLETFEILHHVGLIRNFQWRESQILELSDTVARIFMKSSTRFGPRTVTTDMSHQQLLQHHINRQKIAIEKPERLQLGPEEIKQLRLVYGFVYLPKHLRQTTEVLEEGRAVHVDFVKRSADGDLIRYTKKETWVGFVKKMTQDETSESGADCLLAMYKQRDAPLVKVYDDLSGRPRINELDEVIVTPISDKKTHERTVTGLKEFCSPNRTDLDQLRSAIVFAPEKFVSEVDLTLGVPQSPLNQEWFEDAVEEIKTLDGTYRKQFEVIMSCRAVQNLLLFILGGAGTQKTWTVVWMTVLLSAIGHKFHITTEDNNAVSHFLNTCHRAIKLAKEKKFKFAEKLDKVKILRFVALPRELRFIQAGQVVGQEGMVTYSAKTETNYQEDQRAVQMIVAWNEDLRKAREKDQLTRAQILATTSEKARQITRKLENLKRDYEMLAPEETVIESLAPTTLPYHINRLIEQDQINNSQVTAEYQRLINVVRQKEHTFSDEKDLCAALGNLLKVIMKDCSILGSTYATALDELLQQNWNPSLWVHEECSKTKVATACTVFAKKGVQAHIIVGDRHQLGPYKQGVQFNEANRTSEMSISDLLIQKGVSSQFLDTQSRMHPDISKWPGEFFYEDKLKNHRCVLPSNKNREAFLKVMTHRYGDKKIVRSQYYFVDAINGVAVREEAGTSLENHANAEIAVSIFCDLHRAGIPVEDIGFLSFYAAQLKELRRRLTGLGFDTTRITIESVEKYQSRDKSIMICDNPATAHQLRYLQETDDRIQPFSGITSFASSGPRFCVMCTRAKDGLVFIGHAMSLTSTAGRRFDDKTTRAVKDIVRDAIARNVYISDDTQDSNPVFRTGMTANAMEELLELNAKIENSEWKRTVVEKFKFNARRNDKMPVPAYQGENFGTRYEVYPAEVANAVKKREEYLTARARKAEVGEGGSGGLPAKGSSKTAKPKGDWANVRSMGRWEA